MHSRICHPTGAILSYVIIFKNIDKLNAILSYVIIFKNIDKLNKNRSLQ